jgi:hypothetical protein
LACTGITAGHNRRASVQHEACKTEFAADSALDRHTISARTSTGVSSKQAPLGEISPEIRGEESRGCLTVRLVDSHPFSLASTASDG